jgi:hypothetical protein
MNRKLTMICPELTSGGVGDYTHLLLEHLPPQLTFRLLVPRIGSRPINIFANHPVEEMDGTAEDLGRRLVKSGEIVFVQYSAYGFNDNGYPRWLINALIDWKKRSECVLVIMFHEIWTFWPLWNPNYILQRLHRRDLGRLLRVCDVIFTSTPSQATHLTALSPQSRVEVLPVGSNIRPIQSLNDDREAGTAVLFGLQQGRIRVLRKMGRDLKALGAAKAIRKIITVGGGQSAAGSAEEFACLMELDLPEGFDQAGPLPEEKISELFLTSSFGISLQDDLSVMKSGTLMAYAAHGLNVLSCYAASDKPEPLCLMIAPDELLRGIEPSELRARGEQLRKWQERTSNWPQIASRVMQALQL